MTQSLSVPRLDVLFHPDHRADPYPTYRRWRAYSPVARLDEQIFVLTGFDACSAVLRDRRFGHADPGAPGPLHRDAEHLSRDETGQRSRSLLRMNPPDHTRVRRLISSTFIRSLSGLSGRIEAMTRELLGAMSASTGPVDLIESLAYPLPVMVIGELLGIPEPDRETFARWSHELVWGLVPEFLLPTGVRARIFHAREEFVDYVRRLIEARRRSPTTDLLSVLVGACDSGGSLTRNEVVTTCMLLLIAGHETTVNLIGNGVLALLRNPEQFAQLRADPALIEPAVEELLRFDAPAQLTMRSALADAEVAGTRIPRGSVVLLLLGAANRDPTVHMRPDELDFRRESIRHLSFGNGAHFCLGAPLARLEAVIALRVLARDARDLRLAGRPRWGDNIALREMTSLPVTFDRGE